MHIRNWQETLNKSILQVSNKQHSLSSQIKNMQQKETAIAEERKPQNILRTLFQPNKQRTCLAFSPKNPRSSFLVH